MVTVLPTTTLVSNSTPILRKIVDFAPNDVFGQAKLGDAVDQHAAKFVQRLENVHLVTFLDEVAGAAQGLRVRCRRWRLSSGGRRDRRHAELAVLDARNRR